MLSFICWSQFADKYVHWINIYQVEESTKVADVILLVILSRKELFLLLLLGLLFRLLLGCSICAVQNVKVSHRVHQEEEEERKI